MNAKTQKVINKIIECIRTSETIYHISSCVNMICNYESWRQDKTMTDMDIVIWRSKLNSVAILKGKELIQNSEEIKNVS